MHGGTSTVPLSWPVEDGPEGDPSSEGIHFGGSPLPEGRSLAAPAWVAPSPAGAGDPGAEESSATRRRYLARRHGRPVAAGGLLQPNEPAPLTELD
jgi:hypothetical protein